MGVSNNSFEKCPYKYQKRAQNTGCDLQCRKMSKLAKTEHAQKTPVRIANEGQRTGAARISTPIR